MRVLLDTQILLWALDETDRLDPATQALLADPGTKVLFSAASIWEAAAVATLPPHHRDPFDRLLVAQAINEPARLLTVDRRLSAYSDLIEVLG